MNSEDSSEPDDVLLISQPIEPSSGGENFSNIIRSIVGRLSSMGIEVDRRNAVKNIVLEYLVNIDVHAHAETPSPEPSEIQIRKNHDAIAVVMRGSGAARDVLRMKKIVDELATKSSETLWEECRRRSFGERPTDTPGAGMGLLIVAALSSREKLTMDSSFVGNIPRFALRSSV